MVLNLTDIVLAGYPLLRTSQLLCGKPKRDELLRWNTWWFIWATLLFFDALTFGLVPLMDLIKGLILLPNYTAQGTALTAKLICTTRRHLATHPACKAVRAAAMHVYGKALEYWEIAQKEPEQEAQTAETSIFAWLPWPLGK